MHLRPATPEDKPAIIELMKQSLGETLIPKSQTFWDWKHDKNPFGNSYVLLAEENNTLIGLRAFMQWQWQWQENIYRAIRAVDTATHPKHQGKGIFKKLTLQQLDHCKQDGVHFVFNTPNTKSKPGYLKMGWVEQGKMPLKLAVRKPVSLAYARLFQKDKFKNESLDPTPKQQWTDTLFEMVKNVQVPQSFISTKISPDYIRWRYPQNPLFSYNYITDNKSFILVCRIKNQGFAKELRLVDFFITDTAALAKTINAQIKKEVSKYCAAQQVNLISFSGRQYELYKPYFKWMGILPVKAIGPIVTLREVNLQSKFPDFLQTGNWGYSLGDMELF